MKNRIPFTQVFLILAASLASALAEDINPLGTTGAFKEHIETGCGYNAYSGNGSRSVTDLTVPGALGEYGLDFTRYWNSIPTAWDNEDSSWNIDFGLSFWSHSWKWTAIYGEAPRVPEAGHLEEEVVQEIYTSSITISFPDGHSSRYKIFRNSQPFFGQPWAPDPRCGPPYRADHAETNWNGPNSPSRDHLRDMAEDGSSFWLHLADGGAVHFVGYVIEPDVEGHVWWGYQATELFDRNGLRTAFIYANGLLDRVEQDGGRWLKFTWKWLPGSFAPVIESVETGGNAGYQRVSYKYKRVINPVNHQPTEYLTLAAVIYPDDPAPGQTSAAIYTYGIRRNDSMNGFWPLLNAADDPRFAGPMTKISYDYRGTTCDMWSIPPTEAYIGARNDYFYASEYAITAEKSETGQKVAGLDIKCMEGTRVDSNGFYGLRKLYYGHSAGGPNAQGFHCMGFELAKVTDFSANLGTNTPFHRQNYQYGYPHQIWDGRNLLTESNITIGDGSGLPGELRYEGGSKYVYDRITSNGSEEQDFTRVPNRYRHWLFSTKDELNQVTRYYRDSRRRVKDISHPDGSWEHFTYNAFNQVETHTLPSGAVETREYDPNTHRLMREYNSVDLWEARKEYVYDDPLHPDLVHKMIDGRARVNNTYTVRMEYNGRNKVIELHYPWAQGGADPTVRYEYDKYGNCTAIINELGHRKDYTYDAYRRCTSMTEQLDAPGYDGAGNVPSRRWDWIYDRVIDDGYGNLTTFGASTHTSKEWRVHIEPVFNEQGERRMTARWFDINNRMTLEQTGWIQRGGNQPLGSWYASSDIETHRFTYDQNGQKKSYIDPNGRETTYDYDNRNRLWKTNETVNTIPRTTETRYDAAGNKTEVTFPDGIQQFWPSEEYTAFGQPRVFIDERNNTTNMEYWQWGPMKKLARVTTHRTKDNGGPEDQITLFYPDLLGRAWRTEFPDTSYEQNTYELGQLKTWKTRRGQLKTITDYDARGRELSYSWSNEAPGVTTPGVSRGWDDAGRLSWLANSFSTIVYAYDKAGQVLTERNTIRGSSGQTLAVPKQVGYLRYPSGDVSRLTYPNESVVQKNYTARGQLRGVGWDGGSTSYSYLPDGKVDYQARTSGVTTRYGYDGRGMIASVSHKNAGGENLAFREYWRTDERDRITAWKRGVGGPNGMEDGRGDRYEFDEEGQLTAASYRAVIDSQTQTPSDAKRIDTFNYDELGNRTGSNYVANRGPVNFTRKDNGLNQYRTWYSGMLTNYDDDVGGIWGSPGHANGVLMQEGYITASFNALNQPMAIWAPPYGSSFVWFGYDPVGRCVKRWVGSANGNALDSNPATYFYYDGWNLIQEGSSANVADRLYVHGGRVDEIVASEAGGVWNYHHYDAPGHCIMLTKTDGGIREQYEYDAFGFPYFRSPSGGKLVASQQWGNRFLFTGREWLSNLQIYDFRNRQYQPELGRFLQPDPKQFDAGDYNLYRYCHNDPVNKSDPTGLDPVGRFIGEIVGGYVFGTVGAEVGFVALGGTGALSGIAGGPVGVVGVGGTGAIVGAVSGGVVGTGVGIKVGGDAGDYLGDKIRNILESRGRDQGERRRQHENPNPGKPKSRDHQTGKKIPPKPKEKPRQPEPEVIPKGKGKRDQD